MQKFNTQVIKTNSDYFLQITDWASHHIALKSIREQVFIQEQKVPVELEWDGLDDKACHILAQTTIKGKKLAIGTARITLDKKAAHIGRMAVLKEYRGLNIGSGILQTCITYCKKLKVTHIILNAQVAVLPFYQKAGFKISSEQFMDAGIPHKQMTLTLLEM